MVDISQSFGTGNLSRLSKERRENKSFFDRGRGFMNIHLLTVTSGSLEGDALRLAIEKDGTFDLSEILPLSKNIQQPVTILECVIKRFKMRLTLSFRHQKSP